MTLPAEIRIGPHRVGPGRPLLLIAGPCVIESQDHCLKLAEAIGGVARRLELPYVFKASFDKANRSSGGSFRGPGLEGGLRVLAAVRERTGLAVLSDVHEAGQAAAAGAVLDCLQVPAFLCRQTDLLLACAATGRAVNVKKGQFMAPEKMGLAVEKVRGAGNPNVMLTDRGTMFGYERLINDMTGLATMRAFAPVCFDATHSVQYPGGAGNVTGGRREFIPLLARAAVAAGIDALFMEVHDDPDHARSDAATVWPLAELERLLAGLVRIRAAVA
ncbi:2-dehydro-3-deoxyphosphooctonate aldolase [Phycisphaerae bacterium RAS1]|nr:2-dehydro-3-deoxyphosphooctonate aldolase [Phycisphaerae bacterium RAS1]